MHQQVNLAVHRNGHLSGYDVVFGILVVSRIIPKDVGLGLVDLVGVKWPKVSVRTGIAEIKGKLSRLHLDWHGIGRGRSEIDTRPSLRSEHTQRQHLSAQQQER